MKKLFDTLKKYKIDPARVVYLVPKKKKGKYCAESPEVYRRFIAHYQDGQVFSADNWAIHDAGNAYKDGGDSVVEDAGIGNIIILPSSIHHSFSVNDNKAHGVAKARWRAANVHGDDVESSLRLLYELDQARKADIQGYFHRNFCVDTYDGDDLDFYEAMRVLIFGRSESWAEYHTECLELYYQEYPGDEEDATAPASKKARQGTMEKRGYDADGEVSSDSDSEDEDA